MEPEQEITLYVSKGREEVEVPNISGDQRDIALRKLREANLDVNIKIIAANPDLSSDDQYVVNYSPSPGTMVNPGTTVYVTFGSYSDAFPEYTNYNYRGSYHNYRLYHNYGSSYHDTEPPQLQKLLLQWKLLLQRKPLLQEAPTTTEPPITPTTTPHTTTTSKPIQPPAAIITHTAAAELFQPPDLHTSHSHSILPGDD